MTPIRMPSLGVAMTEGLVQRWLKAPGDRVAQDEPLLEIETDKTTVEIVSPVAGIVGPLLAAEGELVPIGEPLTHIEEIAGPAAPPPVAPATLSPIAPSPVPATSAPIAPAATAVESVSLPVAHPGAVLPDPQPGDTGLLPIDIEGIELARLRDWLRMMLRIRELESRLDELSASGRVPGGAHLSIGQEAVAVGIVAGLEPADLVACGHRSHHHALAKGLPLDGVMAELFGRATGIRGGRGGTMHLGDMALGFLGGNGIVGAGVGVAMGAALAAQLRGSGQVAVGIMGDGAVNTGRTWESVNLAVVWRLPHIVVCENNRYAVETDTERLMTGGGSIARRAQGFGIPTVIVDGQDVAAMARATRAARERATAGGGPTFIEARTYRYEGHSTGQVITYRTADEVRAWRDTRDPIERLRAAMTEADLLDDAGFSVLAREACDEVDAAVAFAEASPLPDPADAVRGVTGLGYTEGLR
jgi:pyruvate dehydrogenase E1 component alpha subunit